MTNPSAHSTELDRMFQHGRVKYIKVRRLCEYLGISKSAFYHWLDEGKIPYVTRTPGNHIRITREIAERIESDLLQGELFGDRVDSRQLSLFPDDDPA